MGKRVIMGVLALLTGFATPQAETFVQINGFRFRDATTSTTESPGANAVNAPFAGATTLLLGKDKIGGNVQLSWSGGVSPYVLSRDGTPLPNPPTATSYDDHVLFDGLNETWLVD